MYYSKKVMMITAWLFASQCIIAQTSGYQKLDDWVTVWKSAQKTTFGYPANQIKECTAYLKQKLDAINWPCWSNKYSNTVFFKRPSAEIVKKYTLAQGYDDYFGGKLAHVVVMQHVTKDKIDQFIAELKQQEK